MKRRSFPHGSAVRRAFIAVTSSYCHGFGSIVACLSLRLKRRFAHESNLFYEIVVLQRRLSHKSESSALIGPRERFRPKLWSSVSRLVGRSDARGTGPGRLNPRPFSI